MFPSYLNFSFSYFLFVILQKNVVINAFFIIKKAGTINAERLNSSSSWASWSSPLLLIMLRILSNRRFSIFVENLGFFSVSGILNAPSSKSNPHGSPFWYWKAHGLYFTSYFDVLYFWKLKPCYNSCHILFYEIPIHVLKWLCQLCKESFYIQSYFRKYKYLLLNCFSLLKYTILIKSE